MIDGLIEFLNQLNIFDIVFLIVLIYFITQCFVKGFTLSLISFMKWVFSTIITIILVPKAQPVVGEYIKSEFVNNIGIGVVIFVFTLFLTIVIGKALGKAMTWTGVGSIDKIFGLFFGIFKGYVVSVCIFSILNWFYPYQNWGISAEDAVSFNLIKEGSVVDGINLIKQGWITADLNKNELRIYKKKYNKYLKSEDHIRRADYLAWENKYWDLKRMLRYLPKDYQALYNARQLLMSKSYGVDNAISKVPEKFKNDSGLNYDRLKWRRKRGRVDSSLEILLNIKNNKNYLVRPDKWWIERSIIARSLIYKKKYQTSYEIVNNHSLEKGTPEYAEAEWLSGWISLSFLNDPLRAREHFKSFYENVGYPISLSRGAYWLARSYEALNDTVTANKYYKIASTYPTTYYGQLAHLKIFKNEKYNLSKSLDVDQDYKKKFLKKDLYKIVHLLHELDKDKYTKHILRFLALDNIEKGSEILSAQLATDINRYDFAIQISKIASYEQRFHNKYNYPIINTPKYVAGRKIPDQALILAVIRQESEFDSKANSYAGAKGMMQLMTYTAKVVAKQAKLPYSKSRLTQDPEYNIKLGSHYLAGLILEYD